jgi:hypothetical protein
MDKKKSITNIQDLGLSTASQHFFGGQPILQVIYRKFPILERVFSNFGKEIFYFKNLFFLKKFSGYRRVANTLNESLESFKKSRNKHFVHN